VRTALAGAMNNRDRPAKDAERRTKGADASGRTLELGRFREKLPRPAMLKTTPLDCETKGSLREKRRDPWLWANASLEAMADPELVVKTRERESQACLDLVCKPVAQPPVEAS
jgi:hypothetical protein